MRTVIPFLILFIWIPKLEANDEAIELELKKVDLSSDLDGWTPVTQSKQINYGEWDHDGWEQWWWRAKRLGRHLGTNDNASVGGF